jgi:signal recognition particle GTPase
MDDTNITRRERQHFASKNLLLIKETLEVLLKMLNKHIKELQEPKPDSTMKVDQMEQWLYAVDFGQNVQKNVQEQVQEKVQENVQEKLQEQVQENVQEKLQEITQRKSSPKLDL